MPEAVRDEIRAELRTELLRLVSAGRDVVLDFSFWSRAMREEWRALLAGHDIVPETIYLATDRGTVLARVAERRAAHADDFPVDLDTAASYVDRFEAPSPEEGPLLLVLDDLQYGADATADLLAHLASRLPRSPVLLVAASRTEGLAMLPQVTALAEPFHLGPLPPSAVGELAASGSV